MTSPTSPKALDRDSAAREFGDMTAMMLWRPESIGKTFVLRTRSGQRKPFVMTTEGLEPMRSNPAPRRVLMRKGRVTWETEGVYGPGRKWYTPSGAPLEAGGAYVEEILDRASNRVSNQASNRTSNQASNRTSNPLDEFYKKHLFRWADSYFIHPDERDEAIEEITRQVEADPDLLEGPHGGPSWTEIWEFIERESTRNLTRNSIDDEDKDMWKGKSYVRRSYKSTDFPEKAGWYGPDLWLWRNNTLTLVYSRPVVNPLGLKSGLKPGLKSGRSGPLPGDHPQSRAHSFAHYELRKAEENPPSTCVKSARFVVKKERSGVKLPSISITKPTDVVRAANEIIGDRAYEVFLVLYVNTRNCLVGFEELTEDNMSGVSVVPASLIRNALLAGARALITIHQHPSGHLLPSDDDLRLWSKLSEQAKMMDIVVLDDFILAESGYYSRMEGTATSW